MFTTTLDGVITSWNAAAEDMFGYTREEITSQNASLLFPPDLVGTLAPLLTQVRRGDRIERLETQRVRKDGTTVDVWSSLSPVRDADGVVVGLSCVSRDMTEHNRTEDERLKADDQILADRLHQSERLESLGRLAGGIAHDFNNLLSIVMNYAAFVAADVADRPQVLADARQIQGAARRAAELTKQLLIFARHDSVEPVPLDLNLIVTDIHQLLSRTIGEHIEFAVDTAAGSAD